MGYSVQIGGGGYAGWKMLERTAAVQQQLVAKDPEVVRARSYFVSEASRISSADELVSDFRLLRVALGAFGLESDINNKFFLRKILEADPNDSGSLVNRLADKRYLQLNRAMSFSGDALLDREKASNITDMYERLEFERRVGEKDQNFRIALYASRELADLAKRDSTENTKWYEILGSKPLRTLFEGAFGFSANYAKLPLDRQVIEFERGFARTVGGDSLAALTDPKNIESLVQRFLLRSNSASIQISGFSAALALLRK